MNETEKWLCFNKSSPNFRNWRNHMALVFWLDYHPKASTHAIEQLIEYERQTRLAMFVAPEVLEAMV